MPDENAVTVAELKERIEMLEKALKEFAVETMKASRMSDPAQQVGYISKRADYLSRAITSIQSKFRNR